MQNLIIIYLFGLYTLSCFSQTNDTLTVHSMAIETDSARAVHCTNCQVYGTGNWCFGIDPDNTRVHWTILSDYIKVAGGTLEYSDEIHQQLDWLLTNAPCLNRSLYDQAVSFYERIGSSMSIKDQKKYQEKVQQLMEQRKYYFNE